MLYNHQIQQMYPLVREKNLPVTLLSNLVTASIALKKMNSGHHPTRQLQPLFLLIRNYSCLILKWKDYIHSHYPIIKLMMQVKASIIEDTDVT